MRPRSDIQFLCGRPAGEPNCSRRSRPRASRATRSSRGIATPSSAFCYTRDLLGVDLGQARARPAGIPQAAAPAELLPGIEAGRRAVPYLPPAQAVVRADRQRVRGRHRPGDDGRPARMRLRRDRQSFRQRSRAGEQLVGELADGRRLIDTGMLLDDFNREFGVPDRERGSRDRGRRAAARPSANCRRWARRLNSAVCRFTVEDVEHNRITRVFVERLPEPVALVEGEAASAGIRRLPPAGDGSDQPPVDQSNRKEGL